MDGEEEEGEEVGEEETEIHLWCLERLVKAEVGRGGWESGRGRVERA